MTTHVLTRDIDGARYRYFGGWDDEQFHNLPYIKEYGHVPPGWQAHHLSAEEIKARSGERFRRLVGLPILAKPAPAFSVGVASVEDDLRRALRERKADERQLRESQQF